MAQSPPPYNSLSEALSPQDGQSDTSSRNYQYPIPANINPTNNVLVSRPTGIEGIWVIDPEMKLPDPTRFPRGLNPGKQRNMLLETTQAGNIMADIFIKSRRQGSTPLIQQLKIDAFTAKGWATIRVHDVTPDDGANLRLPMHIHVKTWNDQAYIYLPRSFRGPVQIQTPKKVTFTKTVKSLLTPFTEVDNVYDNFLGRFDPIEWNGWADWTGDKLEVLSDNSVSVYMDYEGKVPSSDTGGCVCM